MILGYIYNDKDKRQIPYLKKIKEFSNDLPVLIVGWKKAKELYPDCFNINSFEIQENTYWTFDISRDKLIYEENVKKFFSVCVDHKISLMNYTFFDALQMDLKLVDFNDIRGVFLSSEYVYIIKLESTLCFHLKSTLSLHPEFASILESCADKSVEINPDFKHLEGYRKLCFSL